MSSLRQGLILAGNEICGAFFCLVRSPKLFDRRVRQAGFCRLCHTTPSCRPLRCCATLGGSHLPSPEPRRTLVLVDRAEAPVFVFASPLQLALDLFDLCSIRYRDRKFAGEDYEQHVNERIRGDVYEFSVHRASPWREWISDRRLLMCNPTAKGEHVRTDEKCLHISEPDRFRTSPA